MKIIKLNIEYFICFLIVSQLWIISIYSFQAPQLAAHSTALINKILYFIGGDDSVTDDHTSFFYLDLNQSFDALSPTYGPLKALPVGILLATACVGGVNNDTIFVFGGTNSVENPTSQDKLINTFNTTSKEWSTPQIEGEPIRRRNIQAVIDAKGKMYIFGGFGASDYFKDMIIFDTITLTYSNGSTINGPLGMAGYTETLLPNGTIIYIGGEVWNSLVSIKNITMYDIIEDSWNYATAKSPNASDGRVICYGGITKISITASPSPSLIVLNATSFEWSYPNNFGNVTTENTSSTPSPAPSPVLDQHKPSLSAGAIVGITIGVAIVLGLLLFFGIHQSFYIPSLAYAYTNLEALPVGITRVGGINNATIFVFGVWLTLQIEGEPIRNMIIFNTVTFTYSNDSTINGPPRMAGYNKWYYNEMSLQKTSSSIYILDILDIRNCTWISYYKRSLPSTPEETNQLNLNSLLW
ncbi:hypothetical protein Glove_21g312 [Diversispora epigaea]|uniref:Galactose oxidase n=1 Tax=Diversispora epigaea TaxID=1348612 RepID=A0A397JJZ9_9GLOM|nr:hypothetical protein Glove_21g312 [Diversispora epigaea]